MYINKYTRVISNLDRFVTAQTGFVFEIIKTI